MSVNIRLILSARKMIEPVKNKIAEFTLMQCSSPRCKEKMRARVIRKDRGCLISEYLVLTYFFLPFSSMGSGGLAC